MNSSRIFISYSHKGRGPEWKCQLVEHLKPFSGCNLIHAWDDEQIPGGWRWEKEIENAIHGARLAVILLTKEALESEFILERELKPLSQREKDGLIVIPILCEPCSWNEHPWLKLVQIRPFEAKPLSTITDEAELQSILRRLATEIAEELGRSALAQIPPAAESQGDMREYLDKFPLTRGTGLREEKLIGREQELALLDLAFAQPHTAIVSLVAWGGVGKTMLVQHWLQRLQRESWFGTRRVYAWSFYSQGTQEDRQASEDMFLAHALEWFGVQCEPTLSPWDKGRLLADAVARERTLLILDGIEPLQYPPGPMGGHLRAPGVQSLLKQLARKAAPSINNSLCLVTTREPLTDLADFQRREGSPWGSVLRVDLGNLTEEAGAALLHHAGANRAGAAEIKPDDKELLAASREVDGHALTLNLLGRFLARAHGCDVRRRDLVKFEEADRKEQGGTTFKMLAAFENWFARSGEFGARQIAVLRILGLFDRPADAGCIGALRKPPAIPGITRPLFVPNIRFLGIAVSLKSMSDEDWNTAVSFLSDFGLITIQEANSTAMLDCHPLIREHFAKNLQGKKAKEWRVAHRRLYEHLKNTTKESAKPTFEELEPLYHAIVHGCEAKMHQSAFDEVFSNRIDKGGADHSVNRLGAYTSTLSALSCFFDRPWKQISPKLGKTWHAWALHGAAYCLAAVGRLAEAIEPTRTSMEMDVFLRRWKGAAHSAYNLSEFELTLGYIQQAILDANQSVVFADQSDDFLVKWCSRTHLGSALHEAGNDADGMTVFREAESILLSRQPRARYLYGEAGFRYCDLLLAEAERSAFQSNPPSSVPEGLESLCSEMVLRAENALSAATRGSQNALSIALSHLTLARIGLYRPGYPLSEPDSVTDFDQAVDNLRLAGRHDIIPRGLLSRAWLRSLKGNMGAAQADLNEAYDIAARGPMRLHLADIHLYRARFFFREEPYPWISPLDDLAAAEKLINQCGYHRRDQELVHAKRLIRGE